MIKVVYTALLADGLIRKIEIDGPCAVIYTAENNNHAAEILRDHVFGLIPKELKKDFIKKVQFLNTVIGKMSQVIFKTDEIMAYGLTPITPDIKRAFLVESFNKILISKITFTESL